MSAVIGIDPSLTATGLAIIRGDQIATATITTTGKRGDTIHQRSDRITTITKQVTTQIKLDLITWPVSLVVIEGPSYASVGGSQWDRAALWHSIIRATREWPTAIVAPATRARWVTGNGRADKAAVAATIARLCPDTQLRNSDEADALALALIGAHALGQRPDLDTAYRAEALLKPEWPTHITQQLLQPYEHAKKEDT